MDGWMERDTFFSRCRRTLEVSLVRTFFELVAAGLVLTVLAKPAYFQNAIYHSLYIENHITGMDLSLGLTLHSFLEEETRVARYLFLRFETIM